MPTLSDTPDAKPVWIGCSGWNYPHWRQTVYPKGLPARRWLEYYATLFDTVEVNNTFYRLPSRSAVANWVKETPPGFLFTIKAESLSHAHEAPQGYGGGGRALLRADRAARRIPEARPGALATAGEVSPQRRAPRLRAPASARWASLLRVSPSELVRARRIRALAREWGCSSYR